jgi:hypothetical protein
MTEELKQWLRERIDSCLLHEDDSRRDENIKLEEWFKSSRLSFMSCLRKLEELENEKE